jgi:hypothetical protein
VQCKKWYKDQRRRNNTEETKAARNRYSREWRDKNREEVRRKAREYYGKNRESIIDANHKYAKKRRQVDTNYRLTIILRQRIGKAIKNGYKEGSAVRDLGCSIEEFKVYLEGKFLEGMTWDNYGRNGWHIDHIIPLSKFDLTDHDEFKKAVNYSNLQPLWAIDNIKKGNKVKENHIELF